MSRRVEVRPIHRQTLDDFRSLLLNGPGEGCWCVYWNLPKEQDAQWEHRTADENRALRERLWAGGDVGGGYLFYVEDRPAGWCRVAPRSRWPKLCQYHKLNASDQIWSITCFGLLAEFRGQGLLHRFVSLIIEDLSRRGARQLEAFPRNLAPGERATAEQVWMGPLAVYERAGFVELSRDQWTVHMIKDLTAGAGPDC